MITNADIEKLKQVFPTRNDLNDFARKEDLKEIRDDLKEMEKRMTKTIVNAIMEVYEILGKHDQEFKPLKREQRGQRVAIGDHEMRNEQPPQQADGVSYCHSDPEHSGEESI